jgi:hypothetical protein
MKNLNSILFIVFIILSSQNQVMSQDIFASTSEGNIYLISSENCTDTLFCNGTPMFDIAYYNGVLYGTEGSKIYTINTASGLSTMIYQTGQNSINAMTHDGNGYLYLADSCIYEYNISSGVFSQIGCLDTTSEGDIAFLNDTLYMVEAGHILLKINLNPFSYSIIGTLNFGSNYHIMGLTEISYTGSTILCASVFNNLNQNYLYKVDENNATTTLICSIACDIPTDLIYGLATSDMTVGIKQLSNNSKIFIFPNPTNGDINIENKDNKSEKYTITLRNIHGKQVFVKTVEFINTYEFNVSQIDNGIYFLTLQNDKEQIIKKILIQK